jgi:hypothetical protein
MKIQYKVVSIQEKEIILNGNYSLEEFQDYAENTKVLSHNYAFPNSFDSEDEAIQAISDFLKNFQNRLQHILS